LGRRWEAEALNKLVSVTSLSQPMTNQLRYVNRLDVLLRAYRS